MHMYNATTIDLWTFGATFAEFFTTLHCHCTLADDLDDDDADASQWDNLTKVYLLDVQMMKL
jgi:hypothetical protein